MFPSSILAAVALVACLNPPPLPAPKDLPAPNLPGRWAEAFSLHLYYKATGYQGQRPERVEMLDALFAGKLGMGQGWYHPSQSRFDWKWLAGRLDADRDGQIARAEFRGPAGFFDRLDRDQDGVLTAADFDWWSKKALDKPGKEKPAKEKKASKGSGGPSLEVLLTGLATGEIGSPYEGPRVGQPAPLFTLPTHDGTRRIALADHLGAKPVVLIFGSFT
jgi:hypothetical protein